MDVSRGGSAYSGYKWTVTFTGPVADIPTMGINASTIVGDTVSGSSGIVSSVSVRMTTVTD